VASRVADPDGTVPVSNDELSTVRDAARGLVPLLESLASGERAKVVLTQRGAMVGVIITPERYAQLLPPERRK
jgi:hypothetical protein